MTRPIRLAALMLVAAPGLSYGANWVLDPVVTHTNGMRLASSTSTRSHNAYYRCDPGHVGSCDGCYSTPCLHAWRTMGLPPAGPTGPATMASLHTMDGLESATGVSLGSLPIDDESPQGESAPRPARPASPAPPAAGAAADGDWMEAIETIGRKMMATPEG